MKDAEDTKAASKAGTQEPQNINNSDQKHHTSLKKILAYRFDNYMDKGLAARFIMLFVVMAVIVILMGILVALTDISISTGSGIWKSLMHLIDPGTLSGDDTVNYRYLFLMGVVTVCGMIFTGMLISIISNALDSKLSELRKGHSRIVERRHSIVIGFDDNIYCILEELVEANKNQKGSCIVVLAEEDKEVMEQKIHDHLKHITYNRHRLRDHFKPGFHGQGEYRTNIICRSGKTVQASLFEMAAVEDARSVIINDDDDFEVIRILLAVTNYLRAHGNGNQLYPTITTLLHEQRSIEAANIAGSGFCTTNIYFEKMLGRIMAQVCRQPGLSNVLLELFDYKNSEFYVEPVDKHRELIGKPFEKIINSFPNSAIVGIQRMEGPHQSRILLNPDESSPEGAIIRENDGIIHIAEDDDAITEIDLSDKYEIDGLASDNKHTIVAAQIHMVVLGFNIALPNVLKNLDGFVGKGSSVLIVADKPYSIDAFKNSLSNFAGHIDFKFVESQSHRIDIDPDQREDIYSQEKVKEILEQREKELGCKLTNILLVCEDNIPAEKADAQATVQLLNLRKIIADTKMNVILTSEMNLIDDQRLLNEQNAVQYAQVSDFVVGSDLANKIMAQISNEPALHPLFVELLEAEGSEIYLRPITYHVSSKGLESGINFRQLVKLAYKNNHDVVIGWKKQNTLPEVNPREKDTPQKFSSKDQLIVIARD